MKLIMYINKIDYVSGIVIHRQGDRFIINQSDLQMCQYIFNFFLNDWQQERPTF